MIIYEYKFSFRKLLLKPYNYRFSTLDTARVWLSKRELRFLPTFPCVFNVSFKECYKIPGDGKIRKRLEEFWLNIRPHLKWLCIIHESSKFPPTPPTLSALFHPAFFLGPNIWSPWFFTHCTFLFFLVYIWREKRKRENYRSFFEGSFDFYSMIVAAMKMFWGFICGSTREKKLTNRLSKRFKLLLLTKGDVEKWRIYGCAWV